MKTKSLMLASVVLLAVSALAQNPTARKIDAEGGGPDDRASARVLYWDDKANLGVGEFSIDYGRPVWKPDYEDPAKLDAMTKGKLYRMGSNFWTTLDTDLPLEIAGRQVAPGSYYLALRRSADGSKWSLAFIDPATIRKMRLDAFDIRKAPVKFEAPMTKEAAPAEKPQKLTITLSYPKDHIRDVTMKVAWGNLQLTAPIKVGLAD